MKKRILFTEVPEGTKYRKDQWSWVSEPQATKYIRDGNGVEYDPEKGKKPKPAEKLGTETVHPKPTMSNTKKEIEQYLDREGIEYDEFATKQELINLTNG